jgi:hypothetical protein
MMAPRDEAAVSISAVAIVIAVADITSSSADARR